MASTSLAIDRVTPVAACGGVGGFCTEAVDWKSVFAPCDFASLVGLVEGRCINFCGRGAAHKWAVYRRLDL